MFKHAIHYAHELLTSCTLPGETVIDGTCGNGHDTVKLSKLVGKEGKVLAFDIQDQAIKNTKALLTKENINNVIVIQDDHQYSYKYLPQELNQKVAGAIFNLGYLPGGNKKIITKPESTIKAVDSLAESLKVHGIICLVVYHGHPGGETEKDALLEHLKYYNQNNFNVIQYGFINQKNKPPFVIAIEKIKHPDN